MSMDLYEAIRAVGYEPPEAIVWDGKIHRFASDADRRYSKDAWYIAHDDAKGKAAMFGSWRDDAKHTWSNGTGREFTQAEKAAMDRAQAKAKKDVKIAREQAAQRAQRLYDQAEQTIIHSAYLARKGISCPEGVRAINGVSAKAFGFASESEWSFSGLIVPMRSREGDIRSLQLIPESADHKKLFMPGGQTIATFHVLGSIDGANMILLAEGLATGQSLYQATGLPCAIAFSAGNLDAVAGAVRALNATAEIILCADDDPAGKRGAEKAAKICQGRIVYPGDGINDFNDLHQAKGLPAVKVAIFGESEPDNEDWRADLIIKHKDDGTQTIPCRVHNLILLLEHSKEFFGRVRFNEFSSQISIDGKDLDDVGPVVIKARIEKGYINDKIPTGDILEALSVVASRRPFHPVKEYLSAVKWDGIERIDHFFPDFCNCPKDAYHIAVARSLFISAVARIFKPGCKVDTMVILDSRQGMGKSRLWLALFGLWCVEITASLSDKDFYSGLRGVWAADFSELDAFSRSETTQIKRILTSQADSYRPHYGRTTRSFPRQCVFVGGTNKDDWNTDSTGARRFLPVKVTDHIDVDAVTAARDQLWAEAVTLFRSGETWWDIPGAEARQESTYQGDPWEEPVMEFVGAKARVTIFDVLLDGLRIEKGRQTRADQMRASAILKRAGFERKQESGGRWVYAKKPP
jgi:putative DNA primase/helicase